MLSDVEDGFSIFGFEETIVVDTEKKFAIAAIGDPISMTCGASNVNYTAMEWYFNGVPMVRDDGKQTVFKTKLKIIN